MAAVLSNDCEMFVDLPQQAGTIRSRLVAAQLPDESLDRKSVV